MTQAAGEDSYITGFGVGDSQFGWLLAPKLGEDRVEPGTYQLYALIDASNCKNGPAHVSLDSAGFSLVTKDGTMGDPSEVTQSGNWPIVDPTSLDPTSQPGDTQAIVGLSYAPTELNASGPTLVELSVTLEHDIDPDAKLAADGRYLTRIRDSFGRGTLGTNVLGALDAGASGPVGADQWMAVSPSQLLVVLNATAYRGFPTLTLESPISTLSLNPANLTSLEVEGVTIQPPTTSGVNLPPVLIPSAPLRTALIAESYDPSRNNTMLRIVAPPSATAAASDSTRGGTQLVIESGEPPEWSSLAAVTLTAGNKTYLLSCPPRTDDTNGIECTVPRNAQSDGEGGESAELQAWDPEHAGGPIVGAAKVQTGPFIWSASLPKWVSQLQGCDSSGGFDLSLSLGNAAKGNKFQLTTDLGVRLPANVLTGSPDSNGITQAHIQYCADQLEQLKGTVYLLDETNRAGTLVS